VLALLSTALIALMTATVAAETGDDVAPVSGKVVDGDGTGLSGITVAMENGSSVITDGLGDFVIMCSPGEHTLTFSGPGIQTREMMINVGDTGLAMGPVLTFESSSTSNFMMTAALIGAGLVVTVLVVFFLLKAKRKK
jgi:hypothetical protein